MRPGTGIRLAQQTLQQKESMKKNKQDSQKASNTNECNVFTAAEVAAMTRLDVKGVYEGAKSGEIPSVRVGRRVLFPKQAIRKWLDVVEWDRKVAGGE